MKKIWISFILLIFANFIYAESYINGTGTSLFKTVHLKQKTSFVLGGTQVKIQKKFSKILLISTPSNKGYVPAAQVTSTPNKFSTPSHSFVIDETIKTTSSNSILVYAIQDNLVFYDVINRKPLFKEKIPAPNSIKSSENLRHILLIGHYRSKNIEIDNYTLCNSENHQFFEMGSFQHPNQLLTTADFSTDGRFLFLLFKNQKTQWLYLYSTKSANQIGSFQNILSADWDQNDLILLTPKGISRIKPSQNYFLSDAQKFRKWTKTIRSHHPNMRILDGNIYLSLKDQIYQLDISGKISKSSLKSLLFSKNFHYQYFEKKRAHYLQNLHSGSNLRHFSGVHPRRSFYDFFDGKILYQASIEKIQTFFLLNPETRQTYKYRSIDQIDAKSKDGILAEIIDEKDIHLIAIENPNLNSFYFITENLNP